MSEDGAIAPTDGGVPQRLLPGTRAELKHLARQAEKIIKVMGKIDQDSRMRLQLNARRKQLTEESKSQIELIDRLKAEERVYTKDDEVIVTFLARQEELTRQDNELSRHTNEFCDFASPHRAAGFSVALETHGFHVFPYLSHEQRRTINQYREAYHVALRADQECDADWSQPLKLDLFSQNIVAWIDYWQVFRLSVQCLLTEIIRKLGSLEGERNPDKSGGLPGRALRADLDAEQANPPAAEIDGPYPPSGIRFNGKIVELEPIPWRIVEYMWDRDSATISEVCDYVWGETADTVTDSRINSAKCKVNEALLKLGVKWSLGRKSGHIRKL